MVRFAVAFLWIGFIAAFFGYAGVTTGSVEVARGLFLFCLIGFLVSAAVVLTESRRMHR